MQLKLHYLPAGLGEKVDVHADLSISGSSFTMADFVAVATTISTSTSAEARTFQLKPAFPEGHRKLAFRSRLAEERNGNTTAGVVAVATTPRTQACTSKQQDTH